MQAQHKHIMWGKIAATKSVEDVLGTTFYYIDFADAFCYGVGFALMNFVLYCFLTAILTTEIHSLWRNLQVIRMNDDTTSALMSRFVVEDKVISLIRQKYGGTIIRKLRHDNQAVDAPKIMRINMESVRDK